MLDLQFIEISPGSYQKGYDNLLLGNTPFTQYSSSMGISTPFKVLATPVTQGLWGRIMGTKPWTEKIYYDIGVEQQPSRIYDNDAFQEGDDYPAVGMTWEEANVFSVCLGQELGGQHCRLPTDVEWEYCCRAGTNTETYLGDVTRESYRDIDCRFEEHEWFRKNSAGRLQTVASKEPNPWGIYDMAGLVAEWTADHADYGRGSAFLAPRHYPNEAVDFHSVSGEFRIVKGATFESNFLGLASSKIFGLFLPTCRRVDVGFRVVIEETS